MKDPNKERKVRKWKDSEDTRRGRTIWEKEWRGGGVNVVSRRGKGSLPQGKFKN